MALYSVFGSIGDPDLYFSQHILNVMRLIMIYICLLHNRQISS